MKMPHGKSSLRKNHFIKAITCCCAILLGNLAFGTVRAEAQGEMPPAPAAPRTVALPRPVEKTLPNGLRVIVIERPESVPLVTIETLIKTGSEADPPMLAGASDMTAELLRQGTTTRTAPQIAEAIEALGGSIETGAGWDAARVNVDVLTTKADAMMGLLADVVRRPAFKSEEIERLRQQTLDELAVSLSQPGTLARAVAARVLYGDSPYAHPIGGTPESIARIKRDDIIRLHTTYYRPDNALLIISGKIKADDAFKLAARYFGDWTKPAAPLPKNSDFVRALENAPEKSRVVVIDKPDAGQSAVVLTRGGIKRADPDYYRGLVANAVLGGGYSARLNQEVRIKRGLSYGASSALDTRRDAGPFVAATQTKNESGAEVASLLLTELSRLSVEQISEGELTPRKASLIGNESRELETNDGLVEIVGALALYNLSYDELTAYTAQVQAVTVGDVQRFAKGRLGAQGADLIIVGNAKLFLADLRRTYPNAEVIPISELDLNSASLRRTPSGAAKTKG